MIPHKFFNFGHLDKLADCLHPSLTMWLIDLGKKDLCRLSSEEARDRELITESGVHCEHVFHALSQMFQAQPVLRELALSQKRSQQKLLQNIVSQPASTCTFYNSKRLKEF